MLITSVKTRPTSQLGTRKMSLDACFIIKMSSFAPNCLEIQLYIFINATLPVLYVL